MTMTLPDRTPKHVSEWSRGQCELCDAIAVCDDIKRPPPAKPGSLALIRKERDERRHHHTSTMGNQMRQETNSSIVSFFIGMTVAFVIATLMVIFSG